MIFFNNVGYLGMCGHGTIGVVATLAHLGDRRRASIGSKRRWASSRARCTPDGTVTVENVPSYRQRKDVAVDVDGHRSRDGRRRLGRELVLPGERHGATLELADVEALTDSPGASARR